MPPRTYVYVDGFNLYYGAVKDTKLKWLDLRQLCQLLLPGLSIDKIKYFSCPDSERPVTFKVERIPVNQGEIPLRKS